MRAGLGILAPSVLTVSNAVNRTPLRILQAVSSSATSGAELHAVQIARLLQDRGYQVDFLAPSPDPMFDELEDEGIPVHVIDMKRGKGIPGTFALAKLIGERGYDLVHAHLSRAAYISWLAASMKRVPQVYTVHVETKEPVYRLAAKGRNRIIAVSNFIYGVLTESGVDPHYIDIIHHGSDFSDQSYTSQESVHEEFGIEPDRKLVGLIGRVCHLKGHEIAVEALPAALERSPDLQLLFIGRIVDDFDEVLMKRAKELGVEDRITFTGNRSDVARLIDSLSFCIHPSYRESFALAALEAMSRSKPVLASRIGGLTEVVVDEHTGLLVDQTPEAYAEGMALLAMNEERREELGRNALLHAKEKFTIAQMMERLEAVYARTQAE